MSGKIASILSKLASPSTDDSNVNRRHKPDYQLVILMLILMLAGLVIIYAIGPARANVLNHAYGADYSANYFFFKQLTSMVIATVVFLITARVSYKWFLSKASYILLAGIIACLVLAIAGVLNLPIAQCSLGACRWYDLGFIGSFQPAELVKFGLVLFLASFFALKASNSKLNDKSETIYPLIILLSVVTIIVVIFQKDMGTGLSIAGIVAAMLITCGMKWKLIAQLGIIVLAAMVVMILIMPHRLERVSTFLMGDSSVTSEDNYHINHAKIALGSGGLVGVGVGNSVQATGYLPESINDSLFAIIGETFGYLGVVATLTIFYLLLIRMIKTIDYLSDLRLKLVVAGVVGWFGSHVILNVASMIGLAPLTGITLPLLSFGGSSMLFMAAALGLVFQLSRYTVHPSRLKESIDEDISSRRRFGRTRHTNRRGSV